MIKKTIATIALTGASLALAGGAFATNYPEPEPGLTCSVSTAAPGEEFTCTVTGPEGAEATLTTTTAGEDAPVEPIAGTVTSAPATITGGEANFAVTAPSEEGTIGITATVDGVAVDASVAVEVSEELAGTGFDSMPLAIGAGVLLVAGAAVVFVAARRRAAQDA